MELTNDVIALVGRSNNGITAITGAGAGVAAHQFCRTSISCTEECDDEHRVHVQSAQTVEEAAAQRSHPVDDRFDCS